MKNLEIKQSLNDFRDITSRLRELKAHYKGQLLQTDTYYFSSNGRLKIRETNNKKFEIISYQRPNKKKEKISDYQIAKINKNDLKTSKNIYGFLGEKIIVKKKRNLWIYKHTRIHLDEVNKLGKFLELETVIKDIDTKQARLEQNELKQKLNLSKNNNLKYSYSDLILNNQYQYLN